MEMDIKWLFNTRNVHIFFYFCYFVFCFYPTLSESTSDKKQETSDKESHMKIFLLGTV